jgi:hypothetical protein
VGVAMTIAISVGDLAPHPGSAVADRVVMAEFNPDAGLLSNAPDRISRVMQRLAALPGVTGVLSDRAGYGLVTPEAQGVGPVTSRLKRRRNETIALGRSYGYPI